MTTEDALEKFFSALQGEIKARLPKVTGATANSIRIETSLLQGRLYGAEYLPALETGRGPTKNPAPGPVGQRLRDKILVWVKAKGISKEGITQESLAFAIARKIHEEGTRLYRQGGKSGVISDIITEERIKQFESELSKVSIEVVRSKLLREYNTYFSE